MSADQILHSLLTSLCSAPSDSETSFDDINAFVVFRESSGCKSGAPVDYDGFMRSIQHYGIGHTKGNARIAFSTILSLDQEKENAITFNHFRAYYKQWGAKLSKMKKQMNTTKLNLEATRATANITKLERKKNKLNNAVERRAAQKATEATPRVALQMTGRSTSRHTGRPSSARLMTGRSTSRRTGRPSSARLSTRRSRAPTSTPIVKGKSHLLFEDKMTSKYGTLRAAFRAIDTDNDHTVDWSEVQRLLRNFNMDPNDPALQELFLTADDDGDGSIDYQEFQQFFGELLQPTTKGGHGHVLQTKSGTIGKGGNLHNRLHGSHEDNEPNKLSSNQLKNQPNKQIDDHPIITNSLELFHDKMKTKYKSLHKAFRWMDADNDHRVSWDELQRLLGVFNINRDDPTIHSLFLTADADDDGSIDYQGLFVRCCAVSFVLFGTNSHLAATHLCSFPFVQFFKNLKILLAKC